MRILLVHNRYRIPGGEERHVELLADSLVRAGVDVERLEVASPDRSSQLERVRIGFTLAYRPAGAKLMKNSLSRHKPDIVHFHNLFPLLTPAAVREARLFGARVVLTIHNYRFACPAGTLLRNGKIHEDCLEGSSLVCGLRNARGVWSESIAYGIALEFQRRLRLLQRWVDAYIAPSHFVAEMLARASYPTDRIHTVYHGAPIDEAPSAVGGFAFYAGRLSDEKGVETLLDAAKRAPHVPVVIAGDGPLAAHVRSASGDHLTYLGKLPWESVLRFRRNALLTVAPSHCYEALGLGAVESMAVGTPVVASALGGLSEIIEHGVSGLLVPPGDPSALAVALDALWSDRSGVAAMGQRAWGYAREHFDPAGQTLRLVELYEGLLPGR